MPCHLFFNIRTSHCVSLHWKPWLWISWHKLGKWCRSLSDSTASLQSPPAPPCGLPHIHRRMMMWANIRTTLNHFALNLFDTDDSRQDLQVLRSLNLFKWKVVVCAWCIWQVCHLTQSWRPQHARFRSTRKLQWRRFSVSSVTLSFALVQNSLGPWHG